MFVSAMQELRFPNTFNPYVERCDKHDKPEAPDIRSEVLTAMLKAAGERGIEALWVARDLGHRGGRRTGLALTDDITYSAHTRRFGVDAVRPTFGPAMRERTATVVWEMLARIRADIFLWNLFPLQPHPEGSPFKNRAHNSVERAAGFEMLLLLISVLDPRRIVAIGKDAERALKNGAAKVDVLGVRHPSHGGERQFRSQIAAHYNLRNCSQLSLNV